MPEFAFRADDGAVADDRIEDHGLGTDCRPRPDDGTHHAGAAGHSRSREQHGRVYLRVVLDGGVLGPIVLPPDNRAAAATAAPGSTSA